MWNQTGRGSLNAVLVLLVDDEENQTEMTRLSLAKADPSLMITAVSTPSKALGLVSDQPFDCIVSDYQMPEMNGIQLCAEVRKRSAIPFIIYTGRGSEEVASQAFSAGADDYVRKEADLGHYQVLARRIRYAADRRRVSELYRVGIEGNREGVSIIQGTYFVYANPTMAEMLGVGSVSELIGQSVTRWLVGDDGESVVRRTLSRQGGGSEPSVFYYNVRRADGEVRTLHASASVISYKGRPASIVFNHDDTGQRSIEGALRESEERYRRIVETATVGIYEITLNGDKFVSVNEAIAQILGYTREDLMAINPASILEEDSRAAFAERVRRKIAGESLETPFEYRMKAKNGQIHTILLNESEFRLRDGRPESIVVIASDITDRKKAEEQLVALNKELVEKNEELQATEELLRTSNAELYRYSSSLERMVNEKTRDIRASNERLEAFINSSTEGFSIWDSEVRLLDVNAAWLKRLPKNMGKSDVVGKHMIEIYPGVEKTPRYENYLKVLKTGKPYNYEGFLAGDIVKRRFYFASVFKVGDGIGIVSRDATAHRELEREADEIRRRLEAFMDSATEGFSLYDSDLRLVDINRAVLKRFPRGTKEEDLIGKHISELYPGFGETEWYVAYKKVLETGEPWYGEGGGVGVVAGMHMSASAFKVGTGLGVVSKDISEQKRMEHEIREKSERLQAFMESVSDPFVIWSDDLNLVEANSAFLGWFPPGTRKIDLFGKNIKELVPGAEGRERYPVFLRVLETGEPAQLHNVPSLTGYGDRRYDVKVFKMGEGIGVLNNDITEHIRDDEKLLNAERMEAVGKLTAMLAHDLRNPLSSISQASELARKQPEKAERLLQLIAENAARSLNIIEALRTGTKEISLQRVDTDMTQLISKTAEETRMPEEVKMEITVGEGVGRVHVDAGLMRRVLDNLVANAVEAMPDGGRLTIRASSNDGAVRIDVEDTGVGIPDDQTPRIFDPFYSTKPMGLGLGLTFCRRVVEAHGGTLTFASERGAGTTFTVTLPKH